ncbi:MAG TPA: type III-A CRISPR-associated protein Csm2 [Nanoarchaeota archaeon]|nr:type III-A CRISPR-associated protein Csm2 [Nanoarchaeota archaeon]
MNYGFYPNRGRNFDQNRRNSQNIKDQTFEFEILNDDADPEKVKKFLENMDEFTKWLGKKNKNDDKKFSYTKLRKYYDRILKILRNENNNNKLKAKLQLEVGVLIDYDIGREKNKEKIKKVKEFFNETLNLLDNGKKELFEKNWEVLVAYARKNLGEN